MYLYVAFFMGIFSCVKNPDSAQSAVSETSEHAGKDSKNNVASPSEISMPTPPQTADFKAPESAKTTSSGLRYAILKEVEGSEKPSPQSQVTVHYSGWLADGTPFDSSVSRGEPARFLLSQVIAGWTEGLQLLGKGEQARFWIPEALAYQGQPGYPPGDLVFDVSLIDIVAPPKALGKPEATDKPILPGVIKRELSAGEGDAIVMSDIVEAHMVAWDANGKLMDSTKMAGKPMRFPVSQIDPMIQSIVLKMKTGERSHFWISEHAVAQMQVDVLSVVSLPKAPENVAKPPESASKTKSGLYYKSLQSGIGKVKPSATSRVTVHYSGWTTDGNMFDSSVLRGDPLTFALNGVIAGWTEGLQLMTVGEKMRLWIPENLAYKGQEGAPAGMLVFDVELISID